MAWLNARAEHLHDCLPQGNRIITLTDSSSNAPRIATIPLDAHSGVCRNHNFRVITTQQGILPPEWADELSGPGAPAATGSQTGLASPPASQSRNEEPPGAPQNRPSTPSTPSRNGNEGATVTPRSATRRTPAQEVRRMALLECLRFGFAFPLRDS